MSNHPMWLIEYKDQSQLQECYGDCSDHKIYGDVDLPNVLAISWLDTPAITPVRIEIPSMCTAAFFRRESLGIDPNTRTTRELPTIYCLGFERDSAGYYVFILPDGRIVNSYDRNSVFI
jgi:hypothetical protein